MSEFKYEIVEPNEDSNLAVIEKSGISTARFTLAELTKKQMEWTQEKRQIEGQITIEQAKADNIMHHNPWIAEMSEEKQYAVWMYYEAMFGVTKLNQQLQMRSDALAEYHAEKETIMQTLGFVKTELPS